jgi:hypothetical protein
MQMFTSNYKGWIIRAPSLSRESRVFPRRCHDSRATDASPPSSIRKKSRPSYPTNVIVAAYFGVTRRGFVSPDPPASMGSQYSSKRLVPRLQHSKYEKDFLQLSTSPKPNGRIHAPEVDVSVGEHSPSTDGLG